MRPFFFLARTSVHESHGIQAKKDPESSNIMNSEKALKYFFKTDPALYQNTVIFFLISQTYIYFITQETVSTFLRQIFVR